MLKLIYNGQNILSILKAALYTDFQMVAGGEFYKVNRRIYESS